MHYKDLFDIVMHDDCAESNIKHVHLSSNRASHNAFYGGGGGGLPFENKYGGHSGTNCKWLDI